MAFEGKNIKNAGLKMGVLKNPLFHTDGLTVILLLLPEIDLLWTSGWIIKRLTNGSGRYFRYSDLTVTVKLPQACNGWAFNIK